MVAFVAFETGHVFHGKPIGVPGFRVGEVVFNTAMTGYQEILTDPSYSNQIITFTYPHIGNTGINPEDFESNKVYAKGLIVNKMSSIVSNWRATKSLQEFLLEQNVVGITDIDTREITHLLRNNGSLKACIVNDY